MDDIKFSYNYKNFAALLNDVVRVIAHYEKYKLVVGYDIYPETLRVDYEVSKKRQKL